MVKAIIEAVRNGLEIIGLIKQRDAEENTPEMVKAKAAQNQQNTHDQHIKEVADADMDRIRRDAAE